MEGMPSKGGSDQNRNGSVSSTPHHPAFSPMEAHPTVHKWEGMAARISQDEQVNLKKKKSRNAHKVNSMGTHVQKAEWIPPRT